MRTREDTLNTNGRSALTALPLKIVDLGILAIVFLAPLFMGGRGPIGKFVLVSLVCLTVVVWAVAQCRSANGHWQRSGVEWLLMAGIALVVLQLVPLPPSLLAFLSPSIGELLPLWAADSSAAVQLGEWSTISLTPSATLGALIILAAYIMLFLLVVQRIQSVEDVTRILRWVAIGTIAMAVLGLVQFLVGNGKFLWIFEHPSRNTFRVVKGAFHNQNHFAHFLALGVGPLIWMWISAPSKSLQKHMIGMGLGLVFVAALLTFSRGGIITIAIAGVATIAILVGKSLLDKKSLVMAGLMGGVVCVALLIHGYEPLSARFSALQQSRSLQEASEGRAALWSALLDGIPQFAWAGAGIGSHRDVYPLFMEKHFKVEFTHGENGYLPLALEGGIPALLLMLTGIGICFWWCFRALSLIASTDTKDAANPARQSARSTHAKQDRKKLFGILACTAAVLPGLLASVVHSLGDFVWYISSCMSITVLLAACACRLHQLAQQQGTGRQDRESTVQPNSRFRVGLSQPAWLGITVLLVIGSTFMIHERHHSALAAPHWYAYQRIALPAYAQGMPEEATERDLLFEMSEHLEMALRYDPDDPRINLRFAGVCLRRFELEQRHAINPMGLQQIREAALASGFASKEDQAAWLNVAIGENMKLLDLALTHCHRALQAGPLQGEAYVYLADLSFLKGSNPQAKNAYVDQAYLVRPHNGVVAFAMGQERALVGDLDGALKHWRGAFHQNPRIQTLIIEQFSLNLPGAFFLEHFQPEIAALRQLQKCYQQNGRSDDAQLVARQLLGKLLEQAKTADREVAAKTWFEVRGVHTFLQDSSAALQSAQRAVQLDSGNMVYRSTLGALLLQNQDYAAAARELQWCLHRDPENPTLQKQLTVANLGSLRQRSAASPTIQQFPAWRLR